MEAKKLFGILLILIGVIGLLNSMDVFEAGAPVLLGFGMLAVGGGLLSLYFRQEQNFWYLLIGILLICWGIAMLAYELGLISLYVRQNLFIAGISLAFLTAFFKDPRRWWTMIPGGALFVIVVVHLLDEWFYLPAGISGFLLMLGFALVFFYLYLIRDSQNRLKWAIYPALVLGGIALLQLYIVTESGQVQLGIGIVLIVLGILIILFHRQATPEHPVDSVEEAVSTENQQETETGNTNENPDS